MSTIKQQKIKSFISTFNKDNWETFNDDKFHHFLNTIFKRKIFKIFKNEYIICFEINLSHYSIKNIKNCLIFFINLKVTKNDYHFFMNVIDQINSLLFNEKYFDSACIIIQNKPTRKFDFFINENVSNNNYIASEDELIKLLESNNSIADIMNLLTKIDLNSKVCPFHYLGPCNPKVFVGRGYLINELINGPVNAHIVYAGRRMGKTSLLFKIKHEILSKNSLSRSYLPIYIDCSQFKTHKDLETDIFRKASPKLFYSKSNYLFNFQQSLERSAALNAKTTLLLLDEYDLLLINDQSSQHTFDFYNSIRSVVNNGSIKLIICSSTNISQLLYPSDHPVYNMIVPLSLDTLKKNEVLRLIFMQFSMYQFKFKNGEKIVEKIFDITNGHPSLVQLIGRELFNRCSNDKTITISILEEILESKNLIEFIENIFFNNTDLIDRMICFYAVKYQRNRIDQMEIVSYLTNAIKLKIDDKTKSTYYAFQNLVNNKILLKVSKNEFTFVNPIFERIIKNNIFTEKRFNVLTNRLIQKFGSYNKQKIIKTIEFPAEYKQAGISILNYFSQILQTKYPDTDAKIQIIQDGLLVSLIIEPTKEGEIKIIEKTLEEYGLVVTKRMPPESLFPDNPYEAMALKNKLEMTELELRQTRQLLSLTEKNYENKLSMVENEVAWLREHVGKILQKNNTENIKIDIKQELKKNDNIQSSVHGNNITIADEHSIIIDGKIKGNVNSGDEKLDY